ncbi:hypothetical protein ACQUFT_00325 [Mammaliicoccus lentus]|uniref:hypothetical protein n=1 Tax=Mammaliicoccus lentus TaxID=42858 RepID=UPI0015E18824|nr:hypothetical protein [Mammaliicoccus lentus]QMU10844.1 hypothetical protein H3V22_01005 [Mammaliicoccus lentus]
MFCSTGIETLDTLEAFFLVSKKMKKENFNIPMMSGQKFRHQKEYTVRSTLMVMSG